MSTATFPAPIARLSRPHSRHVVVVRAEWTKLRTLRATWLTLAIAIAASLALGLLATLSDARSWDTKPLEERLTFDPTSTSLVGVLFGALVLGALGVRAITAEYSTGMIRTTAAAMPNRASIVLAKVVVTAAATFVAALVANAGGFAAGQAVLREEGIGVSTLNGDGMRAIVLGAVAVSAFAVIGVGLGTIVKRAALANILIALVVIGGQLVGTAIPSASQRYLPFSALQASVTVHRTGDLLPAAAATALLVGYALVTVAVATFVIERRDV
jgi:ABC-type transport system involved in multi-copper enzyme maturation permease subunit